MEMLMVVCVPIADNFVGCTTINNWTMASNCQRLPTIECSPVATSASQWLTMDNCIAVLLLILCASFALHNMATAVMAAEFPAHKKMSSAKLGFNHMLGYLTLWQDPPNPSKQGKVENNCLLHPITMIRSAQA